MPPVARAPIRGSSPRRVLRNPLAERSIGSPAGLAALLALVTAAISGLRRLLPLPGPAALRARVTLAGLRPARLAALALSGLRPAPRAALALSGLRPPPRPALALSRLRPAPPPALALSGLRPARLAAPSLSGLRRLSALVGLARLPARLAPAISGLRLSPFSGAFPVAISALRRLRPLSGPTALLAVLAVSAPAGGLGCQC